MWEQLVCWVVTKLPSVNQRNKYKKDVNQSDTEECDVIIVLIGLRFTRLDYSCFLIDSSF